jgi:hypothetical protein
MNIYTHYSDSHRILYEEYFKPSLRSLYTKDELLIKYHYHDQFTKSGLFMENGWSDTMQHKLDVILNGIEECWGKQMIFSDVDIQFFRPFLSDLNEKLQDCDMVTQEDCGTMCAGFIACNCNDNTRNLITTVKKNYRNMVNDQVALNHFKHIVKYKLLSKTKYFTIGNFFNNKDGTHVWDNITDVNIPQDIILHHGNYVLGTDNKIRLMKYVRDNWKNK